MISIKEIIHNATISDIKSCSAKGCNNEIDSILELDIKNISILVPLCSDHIEKIDRERGKRSDRGGHHGYPEKRNPRSFDSRRFGDEDIVVIGR